MADDSIYDALTTLPGEAGDAARTEFSNAPLAGETQADVTTRQNAAAQQQAQQDTLTRQWGRAKAADLSSRGIANFTTPSGDTQPYTDSTGAALTDSDPKNGVAYDSSGNPVTYSSRNPTRTPVVKDAYEDAPTQTDAQGNIYKTPKGLPWVWSGTDPDVVAAYQQKQQNQLNQQASTALAPYEQQAKIAATQADKAVNQSAKATSAIFTQTGANLTDDDGNAIDLKDVDGPTLKNAIDDSFNKEYGSDAANETSWLSGTLSSSAQALRADIDNRKQRANAAADAHIQTLSAAQTASDNYTQIQQQRIALQAQKLDQVNQRRQQAGMQPVTIPGLEDSSSQVSSGDQGAGETSTPDQGAGAIPGLEGHEAQPNGPTLPALSQDQHAALTSALPPSAHAALIVPPQPDGKAQPEGFWATAGRALLTKTIPAAATAAGGLAAGTLAIGSGPGAIAADIAGGTAAGYAANKAQRAVMGDQWADANDAQMKANAEAHPIAAQIGSTAPFLLSLLGGQGWGALAKGITTAGKTAMEDALQLGQKAVLPWFERGLQAASLGARGGASEGAQEPGATPGSVLDSAAKNAITMGAMGMLPAMKTVLGSAMGATLTKSTLDAGAMALAGNLYDAMVHGQPFDMEKVAKETGGNIPAFVLQNVLLGFLGHGMAAKQGGETAPSAEATPTKPSESPSNSPSTPSESSPTKAPTAQTIDDIYPNRNPNDPFPKVNPDKNGRLGAQDQGVVSEWVQRYRQYVADQVPKMTPEQLIANHQALMDQADASRRKAYGEADAAIEQARLERIAEMDRQNEKTKSSLPIDQNPPTAPETKGAANQRIDAIDGLPESTQAAAEPERQGLESLISTAEKASGESEGPTSESSPKTSTATQTEPAQKGVQVQETEPPAEKSPIDEVPETPVSEPGKTNVGDVLDQAAKKSGKTLPVTAGMPQTPQQSSTTHAAPAPATAPTTSLPGAGSGANVQGETHEPTTAPQEEPQGSASPPEPGGKTADAAGSAGAHGVRGGQAGKELPEISADDTRALVTKLRNGKLKDRFSALQTRLDTLGEKAADKRASNKKESGLKAVVNPHTQGIEILHDPTATADSMKVVSDYWKRKGLSQKDANNQAKMWLHSALDEELIHTQQLVFERGGPQFAKTYRKIWGQVPDPVKRIVDALRNRHESDAQRGAEYERMIIQYRNSGTITEAHSGNTLEDEKTGHPGNLALFDALKIYLATPNSPEMEDNIARVESLAAETQQASPESASPEKAETSETPSTQQGRAPPKAVDTPTEATKDIASEMKSRPRSAKEIKAELIDRLKKAITKAPEKEYSKKTVEIRIPGDGTFKLMDTKAVLADVLRRVEKIPVSGTSNPFSAKSSPANTQAAVKALANQASLQLGGKDAAIDWLRENSEGATPTEKAINLAAVELLQKRTPEEQRELEMEEAKTKALQAQAERDREAKANPETTPKSEPREEPPEPTFKDGQKVRVKGEGDFEREGTISGIGPAKRGEEQTFFVKTNMGEQVYRESQITPIPSEKPSAIEAINKFPRVDVTAPKGASFIQATDKKGNRLPPVPLKEFKLSGKKGLNPFHDANIVRLEAGNIGKDKKFAPVTGEITVTEKISKTTSLHGAKPQMSAVPGLEDYAVQSPAYFSEEQNWFHEKIMRRIEEHDEKAVESFARFIESNTQWPKTGIRLKGVSNRDEMRATITPISKPGIPFQTTFFDQANDGIARPFGDVPVTSLRDGIREAFRRKFTDTSAYPQWDARAPIAPEPQKLARSGSRKLPGRTRPPVGRKAAAGPAPKYRSLFIDRHGNIHGLMEAMSHERILKSLGINATDDTDEEYARKRQARKSLMRGALEGDTLHLDTPANGTTGPMLRAAQQFAEEHEFQVKVDGRPRWDFRAELHSAKPSAIPGLEGYEERKPAEPFYSQLSKTVESLPQETMTVGQATAAISKGAKSDEVKLSGILTDPLSPLYGKDPQSKVTKSELKSFALERQSKVQDVTLSEGGPKYTKEAYNAKRAELDDHNAGSTAASKELMQSAKNELVKRGIPEDYANSITSHPIPVDFAFQLGREMNPDAARRYDEAKARAEAAHSLLIDMGRHEAPIGSPQFSQYQLPGAEPGSYREQFVTWPLSRSEKNLPSGYSIARSEDVPGMKPGKFVVKNADGKATHFIDSSKSGAIEKFFAGYVDAPPGTPRDVSMGENDSKWNDGHADYSDIANPIVRLRRNIRTDANGNRTLFLEELQGPSDENQQKMPPELRKRIYEIGMKRAFREAAEEGATHLGWTTGADQAARYSLDKQVALLSYNEGTHRLTATSHDGSRVVDRSDVPPEKLESYIGKEAAKKIMEEPAQYGNRTLSGEGLKIGGEGLKRLYDETLPRIANDIGKKFGAKTGSARILATDKANLENPGPKGGAYEGDEPPHATIHSIEIPEALRSKAMNEGFALFSTKPQDDGSPAMGQTAQERLTREAEQAGVILKTEELKGLIREDPKVMESIRAKIKARTGADALYSSKPMLERDIAESDHMQRLARATMDGISKVDDFKLESRINGQAARLKKFGEPTTYEKVRIGLYYKEAVRRGLDIPRIPELEEYTGAKTALRDSGEPLFSAKPLAEKLDYLMASKPILESVGWHNAVDIAQAALSPDSRLTEEERKLRANDPNYIGNARKTAMDLNAVTADMDRRKKQWEETLKEARTLVQKLPEAQKLELMKRVDEGTPLKAGSYKAAFDKIAKLDADRAQDMKDWFDRMGRTDWQNYENFLKNIVPHYFAEPELAAKVTQQYIDERKKMSGSGGFLKHRTGFTMREIMDWAAQQGITLKPKYDNVVDAIMDRWTQQERYRGAHTLMEAMAADGRGQWKDTQYIPRGDQRKVSNIVGRRHKDGRWEEFYTDAPSAQIINNYLSRGLRDNQLVNNYFMAANALNSLQLGVSFFHGGFVTLEGMVSTFSLGLQKILAGDMKGFADVMKAPFSTMSDFMLGRKIRKEMLHPGSMAPDMTAIVDQMVMAGYRQGVDSFYHDQHIKALFDAFRGQNVVKGILRAPFALIELLAKPIMEFYVPYMKGAAIYKLAEMHLKQSPKMTATELQDRLNKDVESGNNRFGQMTYDNLHMHKTVKDILMGLTRSLGWNWGTFAEIGGGMADWLAWLKNAALWSGRRIGGGGGNDSNGKPLGFGNPGKMPRITNKMAYVLGLPILIAMFGLVLSLMFGIRPKKLKDYYFVQTGEIDDHGNPVRLVLPSYMKDVFHAAKHPLTTITNKLHPILSMIGQMLMNRDFYGIEIRHSGDPVMKQILEELGYIGKQVEPFSIRNAQKQIASGASTGVKVDGLFGVTQAPSSAGKTPAEELASELVRESIPPKARTQAQADHAALVAQIVGLQRVGKGQQLLQQSLAQGKITPSDVRSIQRNSLLTPLQQSVHHLSLQDAERVVAVASPEEKQQLRPMIAAKTARAGRPHFAGF